MSLIVLTVKPQQNILLYTHVTVADQSLHSYCTVTRDLHAQSPALVVMHIACVCCESCMVLLMDSTELSPFKLVMNKFSHIMLYLDEEHRCRFRELSGPPYIHSFNPHLSGGLVG